MLTRNDVDIVTRVERILYVGDILKRKTRLPANWTPQTVRPRRQRQGHGVQGEIMDAYMRSRLTSHELRVHLPQRSGPVYSLSVP